METLNCQYCEKPIVLGMPFTSERSKICSECTDEILSAQRPYSDRREHIDEIYQREIEKLTEAQESARQSAIEKRQMIAQVAPGNSYQ